ncbi:MAG: metallophosphoesterase [Proteobacteria bacterium]|nr:MAG: metallophosphoesterase [Pseudomonadota bacterium]PIE19824.1 MAG: metallophosphoesterase [Pseudomonadota bacterium]
MRFGIFSDVHSNLEALQSVMRAYESERVDKFICLGDTVGYGAEPQACSEIVRDLASVTILGNHDAAVSGRMDYSYYYEAARHALDTHVGMLSEESIEWLRSLPYEHREAGLSFCHGSPLNLEEFEYIFAVDQAQQLLGYYDDLALVTFIGHSHLCKAFAFSPSEVHEVVATRFTIRENYKYIISVGSVGQPRDYDPRASYTIFDTDEMVFEFKRTGYDVEASAKKIFATDLERNFGNRLFLGV